MRNQCLICARHIEPQDARAMTLHLNVSHDTAAASIPLGLLCHDHILLYHQDRRYNSTPDELIWWILDRSSEAFADALLNKPSTYDGDGTPGGAEVCGSATRDLAAVAPGEDVQPAFTSQRG